MTRRARASANVQPSASLMPTLSWPSGHWPCAKSCLGGKQRQIKPRAPASLQETHTHTHTRTHTYIYIYIYIPLHTSRMRHKFVFEWCLTDFNSEFSFSQTGCHTKVKEPRMSYYLPIAGGKITRFIIFPMLLGQYKQSCPRFDLVSPCPFPNTVSVTPQTPSQEIYDVHWFITVFLFDWKANVLVRLISI